MTGVVPRSPSCRRRLNPSAEGPAGRGLTAVPPVDHRLRFSGDGAFGRQSALAAAA